MVKRKILILILISILMSLVFLVSCAKTNNNSKGNSTENGAFTLWLYPPTSGETYRFTLINNTLQVIFGTHQNDSNHEPISIKGTEHEAKLSNKDLKNLKDLINKVYDSKDVQTDSTVVTDVWTIKYTYKDKNVVQPCYHNTSKELEQLYEELIKLSPIKVDMRGFA